MKRYALLITVVALSVLATASRASARTGHTRPAMANGTLSGVITDATTNRPLPGVLLTVGYLTRGYQRAAMTDAHGRYRITGLPSTRAIDAYAFKGGYIYFHGESAIRAGGVTVYSHVLPRDTASTTPHPRVISFYGTPARGTGMAHFGMRARPGNGPFSFEMMAISPQLGRLVVLQHGAGDRYSGALSVQGIKPGMYTFYYVATQENCFENKTFPSLRVHLG